MRSSAIQRLRRNGVRLLLLFASWLPAALPTLACKYDGLHGVTWDYGSSPPRCEPDICGGTWLPDLLHVTYIPLPLMCSKGFKLRDTEQARADLTGKSVVIFGDSTTCEQTHDLAILLSGIASNRTLVDGYTNAHWYMHNGTRQMNDNQSTIHLPRDVTVTFFKNHRHMIVQVPSLKIFIMQRFIGHHNVSRNSGGMLSVFHPDMASEFLTYLGAGDAASRHAYRRVCDLPGACETPDVVVLSSALHDAGTPSAQYEANIKKLLGFMASKFKGSRTRVLWRSAYFAWGLGPGMRFNAWLPDYDRLAKTVTESFGFGFVNVSSVAEMYAPHIKHNYTAVTLDHIHYGAISNGYHLGWEGKSMLLSTMMTQRLLSSMLAAQ